MAAKHRSLVQDQIADVIECSICTEIFTDPKVLPCIHTFCLHCLESYGKDKKPGDQMVCPICRKEFLIPDGSFSHLPNNFFIGKVVEIGKLAMTPATKLLCALCPEEEEKASAQLFCVDCDQNLCNRCANIHNKSRCSQNHQVVELGSQLNSSEINLRNSYCDHHPGEQIKMFCYEDNVAICLICCVESHQFHRCVNVNKAAGEFVEQLKNSMRKVADRLPECKEVAQKLETFKKEFEEEVFKTEEGVRDATTQLKKLIDQQTEILVQNLKLLREQNFKAFEITKQDVDRFKVMIDSYSRYSEELLARGSPVDICRAANQMLTRAHELEMLPANCSGDCFRCDSVSFHSSNIVDVLGQYGKNIAVGELTVTQSHRLLKFIKESPGQNNNGSSDIEVISRDEPDRFTFVDLNKGSTRHTGDVPAKPPTTEIQLSALSDDATPPHSSDSSPCGTSESFDESSARNAYQWSRSIIIENVPQDMFSTLRLLLESKFMGGGNIITYERDPTGNDVLAVFEEIQAAENFLAAKKLKVLRQVFSVRRPLLLEETEDTL